MKKTFTPFFVAGLAMLLGAMSPPATLPSARDALRDDLLRRMQEVMGPLPRQWSKLPLDMETLETAQLPAFTRMKIRYRVEPEDRVNAYLLIPKDLRGGSRAAAVLCLHQTVACGKDSPAGLDGNSDLHYARELAERGFIALAPDYWNFGEYRQSSYDPLKHGYQSGTMKGIWNHIRGVDLLCSLPQVDPNRIGCIGHSLGGHNALFVAAFDTRIKAIVSSCGFSSFSSYANSRYGGGSLRNWAQDRYMPRITSVYNNDPAKMPFDFPELLASLAPRAVFINAPLRDENFLVDGVKMCLGAAKPVYQSMDAEKRLQAVHPDAAHAFPKEVREQAYKFLQESL